MADVSEWHLNYAIQRVTTQLRCKSKRGTTASLDMLTTEILNKTRKLKMKKTYTAPALVCHGNVAEITQILGGDARTDFVFNSSGAIVSDSNDLGSRDISNFDE